MLVDKSGLGILNPVMSAKEKYLSSQRENAKLIQSVTGGGEFSNSEYLRKLREEKRDGQKDRYEVNKTKLKGLVQDIKGTNRCLILRAKNTGAWLSVHSTTVSGTVFSAIEFLDFLCTCYNIYPLNLQSHYNGCGTAFRVTHAFSCGTSGLFIVCQKK